MTVSEDRPLAGFTCDKCGAAEVMCLDPGTDDESSGPFLITRGKRQSALCWKCFQQTYGKAAP